MTKKFFCPIPIVSLRLDSGSRKRICCHDSTNETEDLNTHEVANGVQSTKLNQKVLNSYQRGEIPSNCNFCPQLEKKSSHSPRQEYLHKFPEIKEPTVLKKILYLDLTIDNHCNLKCRSCRPEYSNKLIKEFDELKIPYDKDIVARISQQNNSSYHDLISYLDNNALITITGGEPLLSENTYNFLNKLSEKKDVSNLKIRIFSNGTVYPKWFENVFKKFKKVELILSIDGSKDLANFVRYPSNWNKIIANIKHFTSYNEKNSNCEIILHTVLQAYNFGRIHNIIEDLILFQDSFNIIPKLTILEHPTILKAENILSDEFDLLKKKEILKMEDLLKKFSTRESFKKAIFEIINLYKNYNSLNSPEKYMQFKVHTKRITDYRSR